MKLRKPKLVHITKVKIGDKLIYDNQQGFATINSIKELKDKIEIGFEELNSFYFYHKDEKLETFI